MNINLKNLNFSLFNSLVRNRKEIKRSREARTDWRFQSQKNYLS